MGKKVCIVSVSLGKGGLERSCANLSTLLSENGYDVHLVILNDDVDYDYKGQLFNLGTFKSDFDTPLKRILRFRKLRQYFRKQRFDYILDNRIGNQLGRELYYMLYIYGLRAKVIYFQHSSKLTNHFPRKSILIPLLLRYAHAFVGVSKGISEKFNKAYITQKCNTIYNCKNEIPPMQDDFFFPEKYILFLGRLDEATKNLTLLLEAYRQSSLSAKRVKLLIMGDGPDDALIKDKVSELGLEYDVIFRGFSSNVYAAISQAYFLVLTSRYEGFPMTLVESLSCGTPVVSVDCETGPNEIIQHEENGLLVENNNTQALADAMFRMITDLNLQSVCRANAKSSVIHIEKREVLKKWLTLLT